MLRCPKSLRSIARACDTTKTIMAAIVGLLARRKSHKQKRSASKMHSCHSCPRNTHRSKRKCMSVYMYVMRDASLAAAPPMLVLLLLLLPLLLPHILPR